VSGHPTGSGSAGFPDPRAASVFYFTQADYDRDTGVVRLGYRFDDGPELLEQITFPGAPWPADPAAGAAFQRALELLHGIAGVSYYKAGLSPELRLGAASAGFALAEFLTGLYIDGLAELGHLNGLDVSARVNFSSPASAPGAVGPACSPELPERALVAVGGGKDSLVALDLLGQADIELQPVCVGESELIRATVRAADLPLLQLRRKLAPELAEMNRAGAWNGHVPVTAINSAILLCAALLYGYRYVVFANERSADEATLTTAEGREVNHQYSKSSAFEAGFRAVLREAIGPGIEYFSILRPFSELGVVQRFSRLEQFHPVFSSCNRNFHLDGPRIRERWCRDCPKCRFAALSLALFLPPSRLVQIQGTDLLDDPSQVDGFRALCRLGRDKPFECVGEAGESRAALAALGRLPAWQSHAVVSTLQPELERVEVPALERLLQPSSRHFVPAALSMRLGFPEPLRAGR
jgi:hypothetical protein